MYRIFIISLFIPLLSYSQYVDYNSDSEIWVDSVFSTLSLEEKIGQLFMIAAYSNKGSSHTKDIKDLINNHGIGGLIFMQGGPVRQAKLINQYQDASNVPLMVAMDAEWGVSMRLDSSIRFPWQMTLGAIHDEKLIYQMGVEIARQCKLIGVNINFAPVVDVNFNPDNPIIGNRSFGESPKRVGELSLNYMKGLQDNNVLACAKHFPGHGDTETDSHKELPIIYHSKNRIFDVELSPYKLLIENGLGAIMTAHLHVPSLDDTEDLAVSLSKKVVSGILKHDLKFNGLIFTDALNMKGVSNYYEPGIVDLKAFLAGNDVLLFSEDVSKAITQIKLAIDDGVITQDIIDNRCKKILRNKYWMGLNNFSSLNIEKVKNELNTNEAVLLNHQLVSNSLTLLHNYDNLIPIKRLDTLNIASISIGESSSEFQNTLSKYARIDHYKISESISQDQLDGMLSNLNKYNLVIISIHKSNIHPWKSYSFSKKIDLFIQNISVQSKVIVSLFANPYSLNSFLFVNNFDALMLSYQNSKLSQNLTAQAIFGGIPIVGRVPVSTKHFLLNHGIFTEKTRLSYTIPEKFGVKDSELNIIDSIIRKSIDEKAFPGCQILVAKEGEVIINKSYGFHTYNKNREVNNSDIYDIASITKITSTLPMIMKMYDDGDINLDYNLGAYLDLDTSNKKDLVIREILSHQSGLKSWIPFYKKTLYTDSVNGYSQFLDTFLYDDKISIDYPYSVADGIFAHYSVKDSIIKQIKYSKLNDNKKYLYSDLGYYFLMDIIENNYKENIDILLEKIIYKKLGLIDLGYNPLIKLNKDKIVPTEFDYTYRSQLIHGYVHDQGSAMLGGVAGHAGIFSSANDLAKIMQMYLNYGEYGGEIYFKESTLKHFTMYQYPENHNRRALGFDKPSITIKNGNRGGSTCEDASSYSFGHTGFTGTIAWVDPINEITFIFLSNRINPNAENIKLLKMNVRTNIMKEIYRLFG